VALVAIGLFIGLWFYVTRPQQPFTEDPNSLSMQYNVAKETADLMFQRARQNGSYEIAINGYKGALALRPDNAEAHNDLGATYYERGLYLMAPPVEEDLREYSPNPQDAVDYIKKQLASIPSGKFAWTVSDAQLRVAQVFLDARKDLNYEFYPTSGGYELTVINGATAASFREAEVEFRRSIDLKPTYAPAYRNLGSLYVMRGNRKDAIVYFEEALRLEPQDKDLKTYLEQLKRL
jgi:tetratricopeptide (TPR) repeat protein